MKKESMRKYTLLGLVLIAASAVTAAVLPKNEDIKKVNGVLVESNDGTPALTCTAGTGGQCTLTVTATDDGIGSRTTVAGNTSSITTTNGVNKERTRSSVDAEPVNNIHTSVSPD